MTQTVGKRQRTCIACGDQKGKSSLYRIVRSEGSAVSLDPSGKAAGRGAYVCSAACFSAARKARRLERALRTRVTEQDYERIAGELACVLGASDAR